MRPAKKNLRRMWYALYSSKIPTYDGDGNPTFEYRDGYEEPVEFRANLSAGTSSADEQPFGANVRYDRIMLLYDMECPIDEHSRIWVRSSPFVDGEFAPDSADYEVAAAPLDSLNALHIAIRRRVQ